MTKILTTAYFLLLFAESINVYFTQDFGENGFDSGPVTGEDVDLDDRIAFSDTVAGLDTVTAYSVQFTPGPANSGDITSFTLGLALLDRLDYTIGGTVVVVAGGEGPPLEHFYNSADEFSCVVGDVDNAYTSGVANTVTPLTFNDVPPDFWALSFIDILAANGVSAGCGSGNYCPSDPVTRAQMAVFLERGMNSSGFSPPAATGALFLDVGAGDFAAGFIEQLSWDGITAGCGDNNYCPGATVTRDQMSVFLLRAKHGSSYSPPAAVGVFADVPSGHWAAPWIEQLSAEGITAGCGGDNYCPEAPVKRDQMAVFLVRTFGLGTVMTKQEAHVDLALTRDSAGVAIGHCSHFVDVKGEQKPVVEIDAVLEVLPPKLGEIDYSKIRSLLYKLRDAGMNLRFVSFDGYQSADSRQILAAQGFTTGIMSMDRTTEPYDYLRDAIYDGRVLLPTHPKLRLELLKLEFDAKRQKVDHPAHGTLGSKDLADAVAGVVYQLSRRREVLHEERARRSQLRNLTAYG